jgi:hypothetical protein
MKCLKFLCRGRPLGGAADITGLNTTCYHEATKASSSIGCKSHNCSPSIHVLKGENTSNKRTINIVNDVTKRRTSHYKIVS